MKKYIFETDIDSNPEIDTEKIFEFVEIIAGYYNCKAQLQRIRKMEAETKSGLNRYSFIKKISSGGTADVFLGKDKLLGRDVAIKMLHPHLLNNETSVSRFNKEARAIAAIDHENVIKIFDFGKQNDKPFIVMEYVDGFTLQDLMETVGIFPNLITIDFAIQILSGLNCVHNAGIYHRDIKPANIMIDSKGCVKITDFGIAYTIGSESITLTNTFLGSPHYVSPEQAQCGKVNHTTDIFSTGVLLYKCLSDKFPFDGGTVHAIIYSIINEKPQHLHYRNPQVLLWFADLIEKCISKKTDCRPDINKIIGTITDNCCENGIQLNRGRISTFLDNPDKYRKEELKELSSCYRRSAENDFRACRISSALRKKEQARILSGNQIPKKKRPMVLFISFVVISVMTIVCYFTLHKPAQKNGNQPVSETPVKTSYDNVMKKYSKIENTVEDSNKNVLPKVKTIQHTIRIQSISGKISNPLTKPVPDSNKSLLILKNGIARIMTNPPWVKIMIDSVYIGKTPEINIVPLTSGSHSINLSKEGFVSWQKTIFITSGDTTQLRVKLEPSEQGKPSL